MVELSFKLTTAHVKLAIGHFKLTTAHFNLAIGHFKLSLLLISSLLSNSDNYIHFTPGL